MRISAAILPARFCLALSLLIGILPTVWAQEEETPPVKIGMVDFAAIQLDYYVTERENDALEVQHEEAKKEIEDRRTRYKANLTKRSENQKRQQDPTLSVESKMSLREEAVTLEDEFVEIEKEIQERDIFLGEGLAEAREAVKTTVNTAIYQAIAEVCTEKEFDVVFNKTFAVKDIRVVAWASEDAFDDVTEEVIQKLNTEAGAPEDWVPPSKRVESAESAPEPADSP